MESCEVEEVAFCGKYGWDDAFALVEGYYDEMIRREVAYSTCREEAEVFEEILLCYIRGPGQSRYESKQREENSQLHPPNNLPK